MKGLYLAGACFALGLFILANGCSTGKKVSMTNEPVMIVPTSIPEPVATESPLVQKPVETYEVMKGDCLWTIAGQVYDDPFQWPTIWHANRDIVSNPDLIEPGQVLETPKDADLVANSRLEASGWPVYRRHKKSSK
ncbi:MAG: LysM peptidoglycan-binding domain-containing protein [Patescibacteria group bacterium]|nr:LysM peptidoglycan-binding domain-containing protein [Patescibacteria group bacterium]